MRQRRRPTGWLPPSTWHEKHRAVEGVCPFCGATQAIILTLTTNMYVVQCGVCGAQGPWDYDAARTVLAWQSRDGLPWRSCPVCRERFVPRRQNHIYDRPHCAQRAWHQRRAAS